MLLRIIKKRGGSEKCNTRIEVNKSNKKNRKSFRKQIIVIEILSEILVIATDN